MYGTEKLEEYIKKRRTGYTISLVSYLSVLAVSIAVLATLSGYIALFILSLIGIIFSCSALVALRKRKPAHLTGRTYVGKISEVSVTASTKDTVKGSSSIRIINRKYDTYRTQVLSLSLYLTVTDDLADGSTETDDKDGNVLIHTVSPVTEEVSEYYRKGDSVLLVSGAKYPLILSLTPDTPSYVSRVTDRYPCPLCGKFREREDTSCGFCGAPPSSISLDIPTKDKSSRLR